MRPLKNICVALILLSAFSAPGWAGIMLDRVVAVVNDEAITWGELYKAMEFELSRQMRSLSIEQKKAVFEENEAQFLEDMINMRLQLQEARNLRIGVAPGEVEVTIAGIRRKYSLSDEAFAVALEADGFTLDEYKKRLAEQLVIGKLIDVAVRGKIVITDADLKGVPEGDAFYRVSQIFFKPGPGADDKARKVMAEVESGADFAGLAGKHSEDSTALQGGDLGLIQKSKMSREFAAAVEGLSPGQVSQPFRTDKGIHILKVQEISSVRDVLTEERLNEAYSDWLRGLREKAFIEVRL